MRSPTGRGTRTRPTVRHLQVGLAVLWLLDGALQLQPFMFTRGFGAQVIAPAAQGQPLAVRAPVLWAAGLVSAHPVTWDATFAAVQLLLGVGLLFRRSARLALAGSVAWAAGVWWMGEGLGGIAGVHTSLLVGAPGAVAIYGVLAVAAWPTPILPEGWARPTVRRWLLGGDAGGSVPRWVAYAWATIWAGDALFRVLPGQNRASDVAATVAGNASGMPAWMAALDRQVAHGIGQTGGAVVVAAFAVEVAIGLLALAGPQLRTAAALAGVVVIMFFWVVGQSLGGITTGSGTDPNTAIPIALLGISLLGLDRRSLPARGQRRRGRSLATARAA